MRVSLGEATMASKLSQAMELMKSALDLLDEAESTSTAAAHLDFAISVLGKDLGMPPKAGNCHLSD